MTTQAQEKSVVMVSRANLLKMLLTTKGATMVSVMTSTDPGKSAKHKGIVEKHSYINGCLNAKYENSVNRQQGREGGEMDFVAKPRKWGVRIPKTPVVHHINKAQEEKHYLTIHVHKVYGTKYLVSGLEVDRETVEQHLKPHRSQKTEQNVEKEIIPRDYDLANVKVLTMKGTRYVIV